MGNPAIAGLYMGSDYFGFHNGNGLATGWTAYIKNDSGVGKFKFSGNDSNFIEWNGSALNVRGAINADDITSGTITGRMIRTAATGKRLEMSLSSYSGYLSFKDSTDVERAWLRVNDADVLSLRNDSNVEVYSIGGKLDLLTQFNSSTQTAGNIYIGAYYNIAHPDYKTYFSGNLDFSGTQSISGFSVKFA
jgi:hypothetical protein